MLVYAADPAALRSGLTARTCSRAGEGGVRAWVQDVRHPGGAEGVAHSGDGAGIIGLA
jgi:hypothetical protein